MLATRDVDKDSLCLQSEKRKDDMLEHHQARLQVQGAVQTTTMNGFHPPEPASGDHSMRHAGPESSTATTDVEGESEHLILFRQSVRQTCSKEARAPFRHH